jgi:hypothetical protein
MIVGKTAKNTNEVTSLVRRLLPKTPFFLSIASFTAARRTKKIATAKSRILRLRTPKKIPTCDNRGVIEETSTL